MRGQLYAVPARNKVESLYVVIISTSLVSHQSALALLNLISTYSYVSYYYAPRLELSWDLVFIPLCILTVIGDSLIVDQVYKLCVMTIRDVDTHTDLI